jgi:hypothetical protein
VIELHTDTVAEPTLQLLKKIQSIPLFCRLRLVGGTALALQIGHRNSIDLDLFGTMNFSQEELEHELKNNSLTYTIRSCSKLIRTIMIENVKVDFVDYSMVKWLEPQIEWNGIHLAGLKDIGAMKISAIAGRGTKKDFIDLFFLLKYFDLTQLIEFYQHKFDIDDIFHVVRSLTYFEDAEEYPQPQMYVGFNWKTAKKHIREMVLNISK